MEFPPEKYEAIVRNRSITLGEAYQIIWEAGNKLLAPFEDDPEPGERTSLHGVPRSLGPEIEKSFGRIIDVYEEFEEQAYAFAGALPDGESPQITVNELLSGLESDRTEYLNERYDSPARRAYPEIDDYIDASSRVRDAVLDATHLVAD